MKILLVSTPIMDYDQGALRTISYDASRECPPYGLYVLATILSRDGHDVCVADLIADGTNSLSNYIATLCDCSLVGISATTLSWPTAIDVISQVRRTSPRVPIVLGGVHPSMFATFLIKRFDVDYIIRGEAEISFPLLCRAIEGSFGLNEVPGLTWKSNGAILSNASSPRLSQDQLASFPGPDFSAVNLGVYKGLPVESARGCTHNCSFCSATYRKRWVPLPTSVFLDNLERAVDHATGTLLNIVYIIDDEFSADPHRCIDITAGIRQRGLQPRLTFNSRVTDLLFDGFIENISEYTHQILVGAECGYDDGLKRIGKGITTKDAEDAARALCKYGLSHRADFSFIIGFPWERMQEVLRTLRFAGYLFSEYGVRILIQWYLQMPRSRIWADFRNREVVHEAMYNEYGFFRNLYLFRTGNRLAPSEIWNISRTVDTVKAIGRLRYPERQMIEHSLPLSIYENFPVVESDMLDNT